MENETRSKLIIDESELMLGESVDIKERALSKSSTLLTANSRSLNFSPETYSQCEAVYGFPELDGTTTSVMVDDNEYAIFSFTANSQLAHQQSKPGGYQIEIFGDQHITGALFDHEGNMLYGWHDGHYTIDEQVTLEYDEKYEYWVFLRERSDAEIIGRITPVAYGNEIAPDVQSYDIVANNSILTSLVHRSILHYEFTTQDINIHKHMQPGRYTINVSSTDRKIYGELYCGYKCIAKTGEGYDLNETYILDYNEIYEFRVFSEDYSTPTVITARLQGVSTGSYVPPEIPHINIGMRNEVGVNAIGEKYFRFSTSDLAAHPNGEAASYNITIEGEHDVVAYLYHDNRLVAQEWNHSKRIILDAILEYNKTYELKVAFLGHYEGMVFVYVDYGEGPVAPANGPTGDAKEEAVKNPANENSVEDPVDSYSGAHTIKNDVMSLFGGQNIKFSIYYNSTYPLGGTLGYGWYHDYEKHIKRPDGETDENILHVYSNPSQYNTYKLKDGVYTCSSPGKVGYVLTLNDSGYILDCNKDHTEHYNDNGKLVKIVSHTGFETVIAYVDKEIIITDKSCNKSIHLRKNDSGKIVMVYDDCGRYAQLSYYNDFLICICDLNNHSLIYTYGPMGLIKSGRDEKGTVYFTNVYDASRRVILQTDGIGNCPSEFTYNGNTRILKNRNGHISTRIYNDEGLLEKYIDENGDVKEYLYDANNNIVKETDIYGNTIEKIYNNSNRLETVIDKNGNETSYKYDNNGNVEKITYANDGYETFFYNDRNQITKHTDVREASIDYLYDTSTGMLEKKIEDKQTTEYNYVNGLLMSQICSKNNTVTDENTENSEEIKNAKTVTKYRYNSFGQMRCKIELSKETAEDANDIEEEQSGNTTYYQYDHFGNVTRIIDAEGNVTYFKYDCNYQKVEETDAKGNVTTYNYNENLKPTSVTTPDGYSEYYFYDCEDRLVMTRDKEGNITCKEYDNGGRVIKITYPDGAIEKYKYERVDSNQVNDEFNDLNSDQPMLNESGERISYFYLLTETSPSGAETKKVYDKNGNLIRVRDANGNVTKNSYNNMNRVTETVNPMGGRIVYKYSEAGDLLEKVDLLPNEDEEQGHGRRTIYTYDKYGNKESVTDPNGNLTRYKYDHNNNLLKVKNYVLNKNRTSETDPEFIELVTKYTYDEFNRVETVTDANLHTVTYTYDKLGRRTSVKDARGNTFTTEYDANGNVLNEKNAYNHNLYSKIYNEMNLPSEVTDAAGKVTKYTYTPLGKVATVTDPFNKEKEFSYNNRGLNTTVIDEKDGQCSARYDLLGNITALIGPTNIETKYKYDLSGRLLNESTTVGDKKKKYSYNALNLKSKITNARGQVQNYEYDAFGRIIKITTPEGIISYVYDNNGNVLEVNDRHGKTTRTFDEFNRVISVEDPFNNIISYEYDNVGNLTKLIYPDNTEVNYTYDENNNLKSVTDWANHSTQYDYDHNNMLTTVTRPDGSITFINYDTASRITSTSTSIQHNGTIVSGYSYVYDDLGRILTETDFVTDIQTSYVYDELSRVTKRTINGVEENFSYDAAGNITSNGRVYDNKGKITRFENTDILYDNDGNMLYGSIDDMYINFAYDSSNRLISAGDYEYTYNAEDVRIQSECSNSNTVTHYVYDTNAKLSKLLVKNTDGVYTKYVYGNGLIGEETNGQFKTYHFDYRGSTVAITDTQGNITDRFKYNTYGKVIEHTGNSDVIFKYNGRDGVVTEPNGLYYMRARYYSPDLMRFINADILSGSISNAITLNRYAYANCNPVSNIDPFGLEAQRGNTAFHKMFDWMVDQFKHLTASGDLDWFLKLTLGATQNNGIYHIAQDYWQSWAFVGYNDFYDWAFEFGTGLTGTTMDSDKFSFTTEDGTKYVIWVWKGDYINLGSGAEVGIYKESFIPGHWFTSTENAMPMSLKLEEIDSGEVLFDYKPSEKQWWITGFDPSNQNAQSNNLKSTVTIDFSGNKEIGEAFKEVWKDDWTFDGMKATLVW